MCLKEGRVTVRTTDMAPDAMIGREHEKPITVNGEELELPGSKLPLLPHTLTHILAHTISLSLSISLILVLVEIQLPLLVAV